MAYPTSQAQIQCPQCQQPMTVTVQQVIDVGTEPTLRDRLLRGRLNVARCPRCNIGGALAMPLIYHDPAHDLLLAYVPHEMNLPMSEEEKEIGRLTNMVLDHTPAEKRKAYLLNPTRVMTHEGLLEKIMEAEGVSPEQVRKQNEKIRLVMQMAQAVGNETKLAALIEENKEVIDYNFLLLITMTMQQAGETHDEATVERYGTLRETIITQLDLKADQVPSLGLEEPMNGLIEALLATPQDELEPAVAANRPLLDYNFFLHLSQRAEQSSGEEKAALLALRGQLVEITERMDRLAQQAIERAATQLNELLRAEDIDAKIQEMYHEFDEAFLVVLSANVEQARTQKRDDIVEALTTIYTRVIKAMETRLRPELRAMNHLLRMESSAERKERLRKELRTYNPAGFIEMIEAIAGDLEDAGGADPAVLERLYTIADEAREIASSDLEFVPPTESLFGGENKGDTPQIILP
ncbi:MAG: hypothetical protein H0T73_02635 [Ardenticatenales bacterium]|nr:hypothetical protein [Ardenticatenales bacterium]